MLYKKAEKETINHSVWKQTHSFAMCKHVPNPAWCLMRTEIPA